MPFTNYLIYQAMPNYQKNKNLLTKYMSLLICTIIFTACVPIKYGDIQTDEKGTLVGLEADEAPEKYQQSSDELFQLVMSLDESIDPVEARDLADSSIYRAMSLAKEFNLTWPPVWHNVLVNYGYRPRGLCIHFCYDLITMLREKNYKTMQFHWGIANEGSNYPLEHSSPVVTAIGQDFYAGVVLDAWRSSGQLTFTHVKGDKYEWHPFDESRLNKPKASRESVPKSLKGGQQSILLNE